MRNPYSPGQPLISNTDASLGGAQGANIDYRAVRDFVRMAQVLELLEWMPVSRRCEQLRGPCPIHRSSDPQSRTFSGHLGRSLFQCFKPCCAHGNQLDLYVAVTWLPIYTAALEVCRRLGVEPPHRP